MLKPIYATVELKIDAEVRCVKVKAELAFRAVVEAMLQTKVEGCGIYSLRM